MSSPPALPRKRDRLVSKERQGRRARGEISQHELDALLAWFDFNRTRAAEEYETTRAKVVWYLELHGCPSVVSADLADVALSVAARRLAKGKTIETRRFFLGVARKLMSEYRKRSKGSSLALENDLELEAPDNPADAFWRVEEERRLADTLLQLDPADRKLLIAYVKAQSVSGGRGELAQRRGTSIGALYTEIHRLRLKLRDLLVNTASTTRR
jgi:DNA-directed RNA polymerase specialized sigma24 family protein